MNGEKVAEVSVNVVKIGSTWYVENFNTHTETLYSIVPPEKITVPSNIPKKPIKK